MMQTLCYLALAFLSSLSFLSAGLSKLCNDMQYAWPMDSQTKTCCNKCLPGEFMAKRNDRSCEIECKPCPGSRYTNTYNVAFQCELCGLCQKDNMEFKSSCNATHNAVCKCKAGYRCKDQPCTQCVPAPTPAPVTTIITLPPSTTARTTLTTVWADGKPLTDTVGILVIIGLLCTGIAFVVVSKIKPILRWIRSKQDYFLAEKPARVPTCSMDDDVSTPVQEVCGKCDQPIDV